MEISLSDIAKEARALPTFRGDGTTSIITFINEADYLLNLIANPQARGYLERIVMGKIQGDALQVVLHLPEDASWEAVKLKLKNSFGVPEDYFSLKEAANSIPYRHITQYYEELRSVLNKLNLKFKLDDERPEEFKPANNEKSILAKFLFKIPREEEMFLRSKNVCTLEEAYLGLLATNFISKRETQVNLNHNSSNKPNINKNKNINNDQRYNNNNYYNPRYNNNNNYNSRYNNNNIDHNPINPRQERNADYYHNRNNNRSNRNSSFHDNNTNRNNGYNNQNFRRPGPPDSQSIQPMDIDNIETQENFRFSHPRNTYP